MRKGEFSGRGERGGREVGEGYTVGKCGGGGEGVVVHGGRGGGGWRGGGGQD